MEYDDNKERYINPFTDFGFKKLFGTEMNKELLISFLNALLEGKEEIDDIKYRNTEHLGAGVKDRKAVFDVYCENASGERFIVEMQKAEQDYFKDRSVFYSTFPIQEQAKRGEWDFQLKSVYTVGILDFVFPNNEYSPGCYHHTVKLVDVEDKHVFYNKLTYVYLEMPKFTKKEDELATMFDKWLYVLRNLSRLLERPAALQERVFTRLFEQAEIAKLTKEERDEYAESVKVYRDLINVVNTAERKGKKQGFAEGRAEGLAEGIEKGLAEGIEKGLAEGIEKGLAEGIEKGLAEGRYAANVDNARKMKADGLPPELVAKYSGLSIDEVEQL